MFGTIVYADSWKDYSKAGVYRISTSEPEFVPVYVDKEMRAENAVMADGQYWLTYMAPTMFGDFQYVSLYDAATWNRTLDKPITPEFDAAALAWDTATGKAYGCFRNSGGSYYFGTLDIATSKVTQIGVAKGMGLTSMAAAPGGQLYATTTDGYFAKVDKNTGNVTNIHSTGLVAKYNSGAAIDPVGGCYYFTYGADTDAALYSIDLATGVATKLYDMPGNQNILGLWVGEPEAASDAPGTADNLTATFAAGNLSGTVAFNMPSTLYDGTALSGSLDWSLAIDGTSAANGTAAAGSHVSTPASVAAKGQHTFTVTVSKNGRQGAPASISRWIGSDNLYNIAAPVLVNTAGTVTLTWQTPESQNGAYVDPAAISYTVTRMPDNVVVASNHKTTTFTETLPAPAPGQVKSVYYTVSVNYEGATDQPVASNQVKLGYLEVPYTQRFDLPSSFDLFTVIDGNGDGYMWQHQNKYNDGSNARLQYGSADHDDWLVLPPLKLKKGVYYELSMDVWAQGAPYFEVMEVRAGTASTPQAMTRVVVPSATYRNNEDTKQNVRRFFVPEADGVYFFGIHATTPAANAHYLQVDNISVAEGIEAVAPAAVSGLSATPGEFGALEATLRFNAPDKDMAGAGLQALSKVAVYRGDEWVADVTPVPAPGDPVVWTDTDAPHGTTTYKVIPYTGDAAGEAASASCFVGISKPLQVTGVKLTRGADTGEVRISWDPVTQDVNGMGLKADQVTYDVYRIEDEHQRVVASEISECEALERVCAHDAAQEFVTYQVKSFTRYGSADETDSDIIPVGQPQRVPFVESVADGHLFNPWAQSVPEENGEYWQNVYDNYVEGITSADLDGGYMMMNASYRGMEGTLMSGNIDIPSDMDGCTLSFYYYDYASQNTIEVMVNDGTGFATVATVALGQGGGAEGWVRKVVPCAGYVGKTVQIAFRGLVTNTNLLALDAITLGTPAADDLAVREITAPAQVGVNEPFEIKVRVENLGSSSAEGYTVDLYHDGRLAETATGLALPPYGSETYVFGSQADIFANGYTEFYAKVNYAADQDIANNQSANRGVDVKMPNYPVVSDLRANKPDGATAVSLAWSAPDTDGGVPDAITDGAEAYTPFSIGLPTSSVDDDSMGEWTVIDGDGMETFILTNVPFPNSGKPMAFVVFNGELTGVDGCFAGNQMWMCFGATDPKSDYAPVQNDDWLISPQLYGGAQTVRFHARSMNGQFLESMEMYYSTGSTAKADFIKAGEVREVAAGWTEYTFDIPDGARRFALRCNSYDKFALCIDDVTYVPEDPATANLDIEGYNVYRNRERLNTAPVKSTYFTDENPLSGEYNYYHVSVVYSVGESAPSNRALVGTDAIGETAAALPVVTGGAGMIVIEGAESLPVMVSTPDGRTIASLKAAGRTVIPAAPGAYIVTTGQHVAKVAVR